MTQLTYQYRAVDRQGARTTGVLRAGDQNDAYRQVVAAGMQPLQITAVRTREGRRRAVTLKDISHLTFQFAVLMEARIPIVEGLRSIADQEANPTLRNIINEVAGRIEAGNSVTEALEPHRDVFGMIYIETVRAAEASGNMTEVLNSLAEMLDRQYELNKNVKGALMYPICVVGALALAVTFLTIVVIPRFGAMFESRGVDLPLPTQFLIHTSSFVRDYWYILIAAGVGAWFGSRKALRSQDLRIRLDGYLHRVPFLRQILRGLAVSRFAHVFGLCLRSGLGLIDALDMSGRAAGRPLLLADTEKMMDQVKHGGRLADVLMACHYIPAFTRRMLSAGEEAAELPKMCSIVARHYDREVSHLSKNVTTFIEPILIVGLAAVVLVIALAIFLPMWNMAKLV